MPATRTFEDGMSFPLLAMLSAALTFVVEVVRETARLRRAMHVRSFDQD